MEGGDIRMSSIDRRVVEMEFDNKQFEAGVRDTLNSLEALKEGLKLEGATKGITDVEAASRNFSLEGMASGIDHIADRFSALGAIGFAILQRLTNAAIDFGKKMASTVMGPLIEGGRRRALNLEQAHFMFEGLGMDAEAVMDNALEAVLGTAFGLDEAAKAASQFGASGMEAGEEMTSALRAISGVAAMTNSSYEDMSQVFTKVAGNGRLMGDDLLRLSSRGLNAAAVLAEAFDMTEGEIRELVTAGEVSFEMFYSAMDEAFGEQATRANETYTGSLANMRAALSRIGASFFGTWLVQQRDLFNTLTPAIDAVGDALSPVIDALLGFTDTGTNRLIDFIEGINFDRLPLLVRPALGIIQNIFQLIGDVINPVREAFRQIFPPATSKQIYMILRAIQDFTHSIKMGEETADKVRRSFAGLFAVLGIGWEVVKAGIVFFMDLFGSVTGSSFGFLDATASIGDFLVALHEAIKNGEGLSKFFEGLNAVLKPAVEFIRNFARAVFDLFTFDFEGIDADRMTEGFEALGGVGAAIRRSWERVLNVLKTVWDFFKPFAHQLGSFFGELGPAIVESFKDLDFDRVLDIINTSFLGGIVVIFRRMVANMGSGVGSAINRLTAPFGQLTITLKRMQATLQAMTLMQIAIAVGILAASVLALSKVDAAGLARALTAISAMFGQLFIAVAAFTKMGGIVGITKLSAGLILFAIALRIMVSSVRAMAGLDWEELGRGLSGLAGLMAMIVAATRGLAGQAKGMIVAGTGLTILAIGIRILASSVRALSDLSWEEMSRGLVGVASLLASLTIFARMTAANKAAIGQGAALILLATGIRILASAVTAFAALSWEGIGKGLASIGAILAGFAIFANLMGNPAGIVRAGASILIISVAMNALARATREFSNLSWHEIARGLVVYGRCTTYHRGCSGPYASAYACFSCRFACCIVGPGYSWDGLTEYGRYELGRDCQGSCNSCWVASYHCCCHEGHDYSSSWCGCTICCCGCIDDACSGSCSYGQYELGLDS
jgi:tape measure domain-containing protein